MLSLYTCLGVFALEEHLVWYEAKLLGLQCLCTDKELMEESINWRWFDCIFNVRFQSKETVLDSGRN